MNRVGDAGPAPEEDSSSSSSTGRQLARYGGHGLTIGVATALFSWLGNLLDGLIGTGPLFVILGATIGFVGGFYSMYRDLVLEQRREDDDGG
ncbi:MAG: AtpZ/AtpI family protein [Candidatus Palauibacterales bacterium]|nr:AtpZ/AtpI family protein [Candidatus Palauibacterales bacterium]